MALRYLLVAYGALLADEPVTRAAKAAGWHAVRLGDHILLADDASRLILLTGGRGVVLGSLFRSGTVLPLSSPGERECDLIAGDPAGAGKAFWGGYVAALTGVGALRVRRDPSGALPCIVSRIAGRTVFASDLAVLEATRLWRPQVDLDAVVRRLWTGGLPSRSTALAGVEDLEPGTESTLLEGRIEVCRWWSPWDHADGGTCAETEADRLRVTVQGTVAASCSPYERLLLGVSGGLDSSIVAASVPDSPGRLTCFTASTQDPHGDERRQAGTLCRHMGLELREAWYDCDPEDLWHSAASHLPNPCSRATVNAYARLQRSLGAEVRCDAFLSGHGGDNVLGFTHSAAPVVDRLTVEGMGAGVLTTVGDVAAITGSGGAAVVRAAWDRWRGGHRCPWRPDERFLSVEVVRDQAANPISHPWLDAPPDALPGKAAHVAAVLRAQVHAAGMLPRSEPPTLCPLLAQPVVELCLAIPSWRWCAGGRNRAVARTAFAPLLPADISERRSKGSPDGHSRALYDRCGAEIRERLLEGRLARSGALDGAALDAMFQGSGSSNARDLARIFSLLDAEVWMSRWSCGTGVDQSGTSA
jgi:asparagine synthase (glutamine-hydrolysing)